MILKALEVQKVKSKYNIYLLYGENEGYKSQALNDLFISNFKGEIVKSDENEILKNEDNFISRILNKSLFDERKLFIINRVSDKFLGIINEIIDRNPSDIIVVLNCGKLEKKSKIRKIFETSKNLAIIPFYEDNYQSLLSIMNEFLSSNKIVVSQEAKNLIIERSAGDRRNLKNELEKVKNLSLSKNVITNEYVEEITSITENYSVFDLVDNYLQKNKKKVSNILNENNYSNEDCILIIRTILNRSKRLLKLVEIFEKNGNIDYTISSFKPPIFWKEKESVKKQINGWKSKKVRELIYKTNETEVLIKKNFNNSTNFISDLISNY